MKESQIRNRKTFNRYLALVAEDVKRFFSYSSFVKSRCPACARKRQTVQFSKSGFTYVTCNACATLFVNPRPTPAMLEAFYARSPSSRYWVHSFFKPVAEARRKKIFAPRAEFIARTISRKNKGIAGDIGAGFGLFLEELRKRTQYSRFIAIEPSVEMAAICRRKKLEVIPSCFEDIPQSAASFDLLTAFELTEHLFAPEKFFKKAYALLKPGGSFVLTTLNGNGFDILALWEKSKSLTPPHHLNFFNPASLCNLLEKIGFTITDLSTPGKLDWNIVEGMIRDEHLRTNKFFEFLAACGSSECKDEFQKWISTHALSSHMCVCAQKPKKGT